MSYIGKGVEVVTFNTATTLDVAGNITVGGTVDGRDVATDGTKLDTITSGAIADILQDTTPQLGGNLDLNTSNVIGTGNINVIGSITGTSFVSTGDMSFTNNSKAIFGTSPSLEIYHDGSNSILDDVGAGNFKMQLAGADKLEITSTGVDVTGTVTADGLTVDGASVFNQAASDQSGGAAIKANGTAYGTNKSIHAYMNTTNANRSLIYAENGAGAVFNVDGSGNVGIGTVSANKSSSSTALTVNTATAGNYSALELSSGDTLNWHINANNAAVYDVTAGTRPRVFYTNGGERLRITSGGDLIKVGGVIKGERGTAAAPAYTFSDDTDTGMFNISNADLGFAVGGSERLRIDSNGNVGIGGSETTVFNGVGGDMKFVVIGDDSTTTVANNSDAGIAIVNTNQTAGNLAGLHFARADTDDTPNYAGASIVAQFPDAQVTGQYPKGELAFLTSTATNSAPSEKMRLTAAGNLLVGKTSAAYNVDGFETHSNGETYVSRSGTPMAINRNSSDGTLLNFYKDGSTVGSIGVRSGNLQIGTDDVGLEFHDTDNTIYPANVSTQALPDGTISLGAAASRFNNLYLSGGVYLGGTGSANLLNDYETGTWNPSIGGTATYNASNYGRYTKIGNVVTLQFNISIASVGTGSTSSIINVPFASENIGEVQSGHVSYFGSLATSTNFLAFYVANNSTSISFVGNTGNNTTIALNGFTIFGTNTSIYGSITYRTA